VILISMILICVLVQVGKSLALVTIDDELLACLLCVFGVIWRIVAIMAIYCTNVTR